MFKIQEVPRSAVCLEPKVEARQGRRGSIEMAHCRCTSGLVPEASNRGRSYVGGVGNKQCKARERTRRSPKMQGQRQHTCQGKTPDQKQRGCRYKHRPGNQEPYGLTHTWGVKRKATEEQDKHTHKDRKSRTQTIVSGDLRVQGRGGGGRGRRTHSDGRSTDTEWRAHSATRRRCIIEWYA